MFIPHNYTYYDKLGTADSRMQNMMMQRTTNENAANKRRICKRSDQPKIDRITNNARLILREKLNGAAT